MTRSHLRSIDAVPSDTPFSRSVGDKCPGALKLFPASDGYIGRLRFPGGRITAKTWSVIAKLALELGDGEAHITTRSNLQIRGVNDHTAFSSRAIECGLVPSIAHDRMRNILASPLSAKAQADSRTLDAAILADSDVAALPGRILFGIDSGRGDILGQRVDFGAQHRSDGSYRLILAGEPTPYCAPDQRTMIDSLLDAARYWQSHRGKLWRVAESASLTREIMELWSQNTALSYEDLRDIIRPEPEHHMRPVGWLDNEDGTVSLGVGLPFGVIPQQALQVLGVIEVDTSITPWASLVVHDLTEGDAEAIVKVLAPLGLILDANSPWLKVSACTGLPGCQKSHSVTRSDASEFIERGYDLDTPVHFSGCERRCGHPLTTYTDYVAVGDGEYEVYNR
ncbi:MULTISPECIES: precorrin-3B synthase [unclassified Corynebacterium]|uniref:precorrin-3B synthase n=1 Tax=unclassified Corynebacterium TaxID=2624378 RepID=UPI0021683C58|nr:MULTISPECIES: precorrin-3B synthase [unclassified Corynebacterium]MCS4489356.1 precorrin-3B synthase [Corynebacterium sp. ES2775-CONJ]MCS4491169.1 precorrin-3B synthase [Corynebacterium sp. ES2715-CONJ3]